MKKKKKKPSFKVFNNIVSKYKYYKNNSNNKY